ncbi:3-dehydroquinate dehydratase-2 [Cytobacillus eiseniae]|uniref:3-dehydroquinate dehydratase n=1 Tax=Cytobacillus eiseniae TaxID=762947 RepID=A0ABS4REV2_9BACI|nr:type II 3-dehydroquinate dehydratase [Cytobacillus eiseniae]MBP2240839.1 3-dehydroquinate dehydratase-2 [Cytobacillus eiseniae]
MNTFLLLNGPNLNVLGEREPSVYGNTTLAQLEEEIVALGKLNESEVITFQSNHEGELIDKLHEANKLGIDGIIFNPGAFTHYSYAIRDAIAGIKIPVIEVHISNVHARESFRHTSVIAPVAAGQIIGLGLIGYTLAFHALRDMKKGRD